MPKFMPSRLKFQQGVVIDMSVFGRFLSSLQNAIPNESHINLRCSGNQLAVAIVEVETVVSYWFDFDVLVHDLRL
jgi:hypothetical protein